MNIYDVREQAHTKSEPDYITPEGRVKEMQMDNTPRYEAKKQRSTSLA